MARCSEITKVVTKHLVVARQSCAEINVAVSQHRRAWGKLFSKVHFFLSWSSFLGARVQNFFLALLGGPWGLSSAHDCWAPDVRSQRSSASAWSMRRRLSGKR